MMENDTPILERSTKVEILIVLGSFRTTVNSSSLPLSTAP